MNVKQHEFQADKLRDLDVMVEQGSLHAAEPWKWVSCVSVLLEHGPGELRQGWPAKQELVGVPTTSGVDIDGLWCGLEP